MATEVLVPPLGTTVDIVTLVKWYVEEGEAVEKDDPLFAIETDKSTMDIEAPASGVLRQVTAREGEEVEALRRIALIAAPGEEIAAASDAPAEPQVQQTVERLAPDGGRDRSRQMVSSSPERAARKFVSPRAKRLADELGVLAYEIEGTGPEGAIIERDVRAYVERVGAAPEPVPAALTHKPLATTPEKLEIVEPEGMNEVLQTIPLRSVRAIIADRMAESAQTTARVTLTRQADATSLVALRNQLKEDGVEVSYNDLFIFIFGRVLRRYPKMNVSLVGDAIQVWKHIHVGLAVDTDRGLLVPVVRDVDQKSLAQIAQESRRLIEETVEGRIGADALQGGTVTLTNLGMYGVDAFTPVINLPEACILGVGRIARVPAVVGDSVVARHMVWLSLSFDHRLVDGAPAAQFMQRLVQLVERPHLLLVE
jgi:pyruvate dehydrogenase E2 component (dihydrolipoamide acetyltransferase)